jgi:hypothetical protein
MVLKFDIVPSRSGTESVFCFTVHFQREKQNKKYSGKLNALWENIIGLITECPGYAEFCTDGAT